MGLRTEPCRKPQVRGHEENKWDGMALKDVRDGNYEEWGVLVDVF